ELLPVGAVGQLYVSGVALARGYLNAPATTADRFVPDPFGDGGRLYRTGDLARRRPDGSIEFIGRVDHQVKVRGHRIELGEIEAALGRCAGVRECVVVMREKEAGKQLVAYVVGEVGARELREQLRTSLPEYMVPGVIVNLPG